MRSLARAARLMLGIGWEIGPRVVLAYLAVNVTGFVGPFLFALGLRPLVDGAYFGRSRQVVTGAIVCAVALLLSVTAPAAYRWTTIRLRERAIMVMQRRVLTLSANAVRLEHFERPEFWDRLQLLKRSAEALVMGLTIAVVGPLILVQLIVMAVLLARLYPPLALLPLIAIPSTWLNRAGERLKREGELRSAEGRRAVEHLFALASSAQSAKEIRLYGLADELMRRHRESARTVHRTTDTILFKSVGLSSLGWLVFAAAYVGAVAIVLRDAAAGGVTPGDVALTLALAGAVVTAASRLSELGGFVFRALTAAGHYQWLEDQASGRPDAPAVDPPARLVRGFDLDQVTFGYAGSERPALRDVTLSLPAGKVVAIVGENGAGKTTLVKLLSLMYAPTQGRVLLEGADLQDLDVGKYRSRLSAGFQDFMRFELSAGEAVGVGDLPRLDDAAAVRGALGKASAGFAEHLPSGLDTQLGRSWQGGVDLSGGEWQKLAIARSLMRDDPFLVIFDEPTASLDPQTEHALFEQVAADMRRGAADGRITLLISHRFSTVRMADLIVVLDEGRVIELGSHAELMARSGLYAELYGLQAHAYR